MPVQDRVDNRQLQRQVTHIVRTLIVKLPFSQSLSRLLHGVWRICALVLQGDLRCIDKLLDAQIVLEDLLGRGKVCSRSFLLSREAQ